MRNNLQIAASTGLSAMEAFIVIMVIIER